ncbi:Detected protein of confused Function [Hibiscus syriacus]|uniref:Detected protein of confused Function n=1 Tax=Hibiscus syriacus TaxID=106335 RepID=A0A6A3B462_HIBSY|nr:Detected protein of confused Function [Hibiscus syriacus]
MPPFSQSPLTAPSTFNLKNPTGGGTQIDRDKSNLLWLPQCNGRLNAVSCIDGEVLWRKDFEEESLNVQQVIQPPGSNLLKHETASFSDGFLGEVSLVSSEPVVALDSKGSTLLTISHEIHLSVKLAHNWVDNLLKESLKIDRQRGLVHKILVNSYIRTDRSYGFRALVVMEDHSLLLLQQGEIVWSREDGLASVIDITTSVLPVERDGVSVAKVEHNQFEWLKVSVDCMITLSFLLTDALILKGHMLRLKGTLMFASPEDIAAIQSMRLKSSEKSKMTRDHNGFRKLLIILTRPGKIYSLHTGDGRIVWSHLLQFTKIRVGKCGPSSNAPGVLSFVDTYTGKELSSLSHVHSVAQVIPLPYTDSTEQRLHLLIDADKHAHLYPKSPEAISIFKLADDFCFDTRELWSVVFPSESEKIIATVTRKLNEHGALGRNLWT